MKQRDPDGIVDLCVVVSESEAGILVALLRDGGIPAICPDLGNAVFGGAMDVVFKRRVQVRRRDVEGARELIERSKAEAMEIDWSSVEEAGGGAVEHEEPFRSRMGSWRSLVKLIVWIVVVSAIVGLMMTAVRVIVNDGAAAG